MSIAATHAPDNLPSPLMRALHWYGEAFRLWRRAPLMLVVLCPVSLMVEGLLQLLPEAGVLVSKMVVPMVGAGLWLGMDRLQRGQRLRFACLWAGWRQPRWMALWALGASVGLVVFGFQLGCTAAWFGQGAIDAVLFGHLAAHPELQKHLFQYALLLPGLLPSTLLIFAMPLFLFRRASYLQALTGSMRLVSGLPMTITLAMLPQLALFALALSGPWALPLLLVLPPIGTLVGLCSVAGLWVPHRLPLHRVTDDRMMTKDRFANLLNQHAGLISRIAASYEADASLRDDLLQEIALALWRALPAWRGDASLRTFVARIAHNRGATHVIGERRRPRAAELSDGVPDLGTRPDQHAYLVQEHLRLQSAVRSLPVSLRQAVTLALEGFSHGEIADALGIQANAVGVRLSRARTALKQRLGGVA